MDLSYWEQKIATKRKQSQWKDFVRDICSRQPFTFYKNTGQISRFPVSDRVSVVGIREYEGIGDQMQDRIEGGNFFDAFGGLLKNVSLPALHNDFQSENADYCDNTIASKNAYLSFSVIYSENVLYSYNIKTSKNVYNSVAVWNNSENVYASSGISKSFNVFFSNNIRDSRDMWVCDNMTGCEECIDCSGLINKKFCIHNVEYDEAKYKLVKSSTMNSLMKEYMLSQPSKMLVDSENVEQSNYVYGGTSVRNSCFVGGAKDKVNVYDMFSCGFVGDYYGGVAVGGGSQYVYCSINVGNCHSVFYSYLMADCSFCLGCIGLKNKSYCILNKQYTKEERYEVADKIFSQMSHEGVLGDFFPGVINPFYFNDTAAYLINDTFSREEICKIGYLWRDNEIKTDILDSSETISAKDLSAYESSQNGHLYIDPLILKKIIVDEHGNSYRIVKMEYDFLMKYGLPLPRKHRLERMKENFRIS